MRQAARKFGVSKSTVHKDITSRLSMFNPSLANEARAVLEVNKKERHIRGGLATREKYLHKKTTAAFHHIGKRSIKVTSIPRIRYIPA